MKKENVEIREMKKEDWEAVRSIYAEGIEEGKSTFQTECPEYEQWDKSHLKECRYVLTVEDKIAGWCAISPTSARDAYRGVVEVSIYFGKKFRGQGLGYELLSYLCRQTEEKGYWCLYVAIFSINTASIALHKKCGFREIGYRDRIAKDKFGEWQNTTLMERRVK